MVGAGIRMLESFSVAASGRHLPVPSMVDPDGVEACSHRLQAGAQAWMFSAQEEIGTQREETARAGKLQKAFVRTGESPGNGQKGKGKAQGACLQIECHMDLHWLSESPVRDPREMGSGYQRHIWCNVNNVPTAVTSIGTCK